MKKINYNYKESLIIHKKYQKNRIIVLIILVFVLLSMTIAYSANLSSVLNMLGNATLNLEEGKLEITDISVASSTNVTNNSYSYSTVIDESSNTSTVKSDFSITYYRNTGQNKNMTITYNVVITNSSKYPQILEEVTSTPTFTSGSSTLNYQLTGAEAGTTVLSPGESITVSLIFSLGNNANKVSYIVNEIFEFKFSASIVNTLSLTQMLDTNLQTIEPVIFENNNDLKKISVLVSNNSNYNINYNFSLDNNNFTIVNATGDTLPNLQISPAEEQVIDLYLKISNNNIFENSNENINITLNTFSPYISDFDVGSIQIVIPTTGSQKILSNQTINNDNTIDYTSANITSGIFKNETNGEITYFYRGNVTNNYVSFAGYTWRIIKIDKYGTRIILDSVIDSTSTWASNNTATSLDNAISILSYSNSSVKTILDSWYNNNMASYSTIIKPSLFCEDVSYQSITSSDNEYTTYYFGAYTRNGPNSSENNPELICPEQYTKTYNVGLISGDEVTLAGALFNNNNNTNYYLYNSTITSSWWTISPSYYETASNTLGTMIVDGSNGKLYDQQNNNTIANENAIRPVITIDTDRLSGGTGTFNDPYTFS